jgi:hypothetical protein
MMITHFEHERAYYQTLCSYSVSGWDVLLHNKSLNQLQDQKRNQLQFIMATFLASLVSLRTLRITLLVLAM